MRADVRCRKSDAKITQISKAQAYYWHRVGKVFASIWQGLRKLRQGVLACLHLAKPLGKVRQRYG